MQVFKYFSLEEETFQIINLLIKYKILVVILVSKPGQHPPSRGVNMMTADSGTPATEFLINLSFCFIC